MAQDTLKEILEVEKEIKARLDMESARADQWLEQTRKEIESARRARIAELDASLARDKEEARRAAEEKAESIVDRVRTFSERIEGLGDDRLQQITWRHIANMGPRDRA